MKNPLISLVSLSLLVSIGCAEQKAASEPSPAASYVDEAQLPKGWPVPGPYNKVSQKEYPVYRAAFAKGDGSNRSFWTLFQHIQSKDIPMTAPVEMKMEGQGGEMEMTSMGFLYQDTSVGELGADGEKVEVTDVPAMKVLSYAWMGPNTEMTLKVAREALDAELEKQKLKAVGYRMLGYNGPSVPRAKRTHELQAILTSE